MWPILVLVGRGVSVLLVGGAGIGIVVLMWPASPGGGGNTNVTVADLDRIEAFMSRAKVEAILGKGEDIAFSEVGFMPQGLNVPDRVWCRWRNGNDSLIVAGESGKSGTPRVVMGFFQKSQRGAGAFQQNYKYGVLPIIFPASHHDQLARDKAEERKLLQSPRWHKGPAIRKSLVGRWVTFGTGFYEFKEDGACRHESPGTKATGTYGFTDDENLEMTTQAATFVPGAQAPPLHSEGIAHMSLYAVSVPPRTKTKHP